LKALVTGANGFLGSWIVRGLLKKNWDVRILHRPHSDLSSLKDLPYEAYLGDITDIESLKKSTANVDAVFHAAGLVSYHHQEHDKMEKVNVEGTANVVNACSMNKVPRLIHTSSIVAIGASEDKTIMDENSPYNLSKYNLGYYETKKRAEEIVIAACKKNQINAVVVNPSTMFGPGDAVKSSRAKYLNVAKGKFPYYPSGGVNILDVEDAVDGHIAAFEKGRNGERYILGAENILIKELFDMFAKAAGAPLPNKKISRPLLRTIYYAGKIMSDLHLPVQFPFESAVIGSLYHWYSNEKAKRELGFNPRSAKSSVQRSVEWCFENGLLTKK
jgi:dihydroflavonol-4-reductase